jgi:hypothetical protein
MKADLMKPFKTLSAAVAFALAALAPFAARASGVEILNEGFSNVSALPGWVQVNHSNPAGNGWFQGNPGLFSAQAGASDSYAGVNYLSAQDGTGSVDNWLITPAMTLSGNTTISFFTRSSNDPGFNDRLEVRYALGNGTDTSAFSNLLTSIGTGGYPTDWTQYSADFSANGPVRFAFRYVGDAAALNFVGIDSVSVVTAVPEPSLSLMLCLGLGALGLMRRKLST